MYTKDKATRITLRLNEEQFAHVHANAETLGISPSEFLRMLVNASLAMSRKLDQVLYPQQNSKEEVSGRENDKTDLDGKL